MNRQSERFPWKEAALTAAGVAGAWWVGEQLRLRTQRLDGQVVLITGGSRGLGLLLAHEFASQGCRLALCARDEAELQWAADQLRARGAEVYLQPCDVAERDEVALLVKGVTRHYGQIDILVNNAGIIEAGPYPTLRVSDFERAMDIMFWGTVYATLAVVPQMRARGAGRIVNITSIGGKLSFPHLLPYNSAKHAAVGFSEGLTAELARDGISVTTVVPGLMRTGSHVQARFKGQRAAEFTWFSALGSVPPFSMSAVRAARQIVNATRRGDAECILSLSAALATRIHGVAPGLTVRLLSLVNSLLPHSEARRTKPVRGLDIWNELPAARRQQMEKLMPLGVAAMERYQPLAMTDEHAIAPAR